MFLYSVNATSKSALKSQFTNISLIYPQVNGVDLTQATHFQAKKAFNQVVPVLKMTVYRDSSARNRPIEKEDIMKITIVKQPGRQLGIKLVGKRYVEVCVESVYI